MLVFRFFNYGKNFGDSVNRLFFEQLTNKKVRQGNPLEIHYVATGSIMFTVNNRSIVYGTGFISQDGAINGKPKRPSKIISVRGPRSRAIFLRMGFDCPENYGDPLILFPCIYQSQIKNNNLKLVGIIPHQVDKQNKNLQKLINNLNNNGYQCINIDIETGSNYNYFIDQVCKCNYIISSTLHGAITGLIYKKKTIITQFSNKVTGGMFKFHDFLESLEIYDYQCNNIFDKSILDNIVKIDYNILHTVGLKMIKIADFIENDRKKQLSDIWSDYYKDKLV